MATLRKMTLPDGLKEKTEEQLNNLKNVCEAGKLALVLGAGISVPFGLPQWGELLSKCFSTSLANNFFGNSAFSQLYRQQYENLKKEYPKQVGEVLEKLVEPNQAKRIVAPNKGDALEEGQYYYGALLSEKKLIQLFGGNEADEKALAEALFLQVVRENLVPSYAFEEVKDKPAILLCAEMIRDKKVKEIVNYNFDSLLEACLCLGLGMSEDEFVVHRDGSQLGEKSDKPQIYHVHGQVKTTLYRTKADKEKEEEDKYTYGENSKSLVFSEESYYEIERYPYDWRNVVQARLLLENTCLFIGFSGNDYNFRRLLKQIPPAQQYSDVPKHYIFLLLDGINTSIEEDLKAKIIASPDEINIMKKVMMTYYMSLKTQYLQRFGIEPIWTTAEDLRGMLTMIMGKKT